MALLSRLSYLRREKEKKQWSETARGCDSQGIKERKRCFMFKPSLRSQEHGVPDLHHGETVTASPDYIGTKQSVNTQR